MPAAQHAADAWTWCQLRANDCKRPQPLQQSAARLAPPHNTPVPGIHGCQAAPPSPSSLSSCPLNPAPTPSNPNPKWLSPPSASWLPALPVSGASGQRSAATDAGEHATTASRMRPVEPRTPLPPSLPGLWGIRGRRGQRRAAHSPAPYHRRLWAGQVPPPPAATRSRLSTTTASSSLHPLPRPSQPCLQARSALPSAP